MAEKITTYNAAVSYLNDTPRFTEKHTVDQTKRMLELLGSPDQSFRIIHVAGTNGKGSVCTALASVLDCAGYSCGLFTSPHLVTMRERFLINGEMITEAEFLEDFLEIRGVLQVHPECPHPTYFEYLFLMAMIRFRKAGVQAAVLETGLGGRLDATNAAVPDVCVITSIGLDHTEYLGDTIGQIASEKAGIIKPGVPVFYDGTAAEASEVIGRTAGSKGAPAYRIDPQDLQDVHRTEKGIAFTCPGRYDSFHLEVPSEADYQVMNMALAACAAESFLQNAEKGCTAQRGALYRKSAVETGISRFRIPGRMERKKDGIILDGANNPDGIDAFLKAAAGMTPPGQILLFSCLKDKDGKEMARRIAESGFFETIIVTGIDSPRAEDPAVLSERLLTWSPQTRVCCIPETAEALEAAKQLRRSGQFVFAAGSLYLIGGLEKLL